MSDRPFEAITSAGDLRPKSHAGAEFPHRWTDEGVVVQSAFTGAHLMHLSIAGCVLNDTYREAERLGISIEGARVAAWGDFDRETWQSTGIMYQVEVSTGAPPEAVENLLRVVDEVAEIPKAIRGMANVERA